MSSIVMYLNVFVPDSNDYATMLFGLSTIESGIEI